MTLLRLKGFAEYWKESPPVNEVAAAWLKSQGALAAPLALEDEAPDLLEMIPRRG